jgi:hypothetical protein
MPQLNYLDDAPVAENDRRLAAAFMQVTVARLGSTPVINALRGMQANIVTT